MPMNNSTVISLGDELRETKTCIRALMLPQKIEEEEEEEETRSAHVLWLPRPGRLGLSAWQCASQVSTMMR